MPARALSLNLTAGMWLVGTRAEGGPDLLTARMQVGVRPDYHKSRRAAARLPLSALAAPEERTRPAEVGLCTHSLSLTHTLAHAAQVEMLWDAVVGGETRLRHVVGSTALPPRRAASSRSWRIIIFFKVFDFNTISCRPSVTSSRASLCFLVAVVSHHTCLCL